MLKLYTFNFMQKCVKLSTVFRYVSTPTRSATLPPTASWRRKMAACLLWIPEDMTCVTSHYLPPALGHTSQQYCETPPSKCDADKLMACTIWTSNCSLKDVDHEVCRNLQATESRKLQLIIVLRRLHLADTPIAA